MFCIVCTKEIKNNYFNAVSGAICEECLKKMYIYYGLRSLGLIKTL